MGAVCPVRYAGNERVGEPDRLRPVKARTGRVFHLLRQLLWKAEVALRHAAH